MSLRRKTGQTESITEGWRSLRYFTDRYQACRVFARYLHSDPPLERILFFQGEGGNGKSLLLRYLREHYCKCLQHDGWMYVRSLLDDEEFAQHFVNAQDAETVPSTLLDFGMKPQGADRPQDAFSGLLMLRRDLAEYGLNFPLYDFACVWYLHKTHQLTDERLHTLFPAEEVDMIIALVNALANTSWLAPARAVFGVFDKHMRERFTLYKHRRKLDDEDIEAIKRLDPKTSEFLDALPGLFAADLNTAMRMEDAPKRVVLFFDTHEAFWGNQRDRTGDLFFQQDEWLRRLLLDLELSWGIVVVVAGRDQLRWAEASKVKIPAAVIDVQRVGHLTDADAMRYLDHVFKGIDDAEARARAVGLHTSLLDRARVAPDEIHPLYLGLCADVVLAAIEQNAMPTPEDFRGVERGADKGLELMHRLLRYVNIEVAYAIQTLSACRAFDYGIYRALGQALHFHATRPAFKVLTQFSFVWPAKGEGQYRIHELLRRLMREHSPEQEAIREADTAMIRYYRKRVRSGELVYRWFCKCGGRPA